MLRVEIGLPGRGTELLVLDADAHPRRIDRAAQDALGERDPWVTVPTLDPGRTADRLAEHGLRTPALPEWMMAIRLADQASRPFAAGYSPALTGTPPVVRIEVHDDAGTLAASGQLGLSGGADGVGVPDRIETQPRHRRRGLGGAMMTVLAEAAREAGAEHGLLMASTEGRALYTSLGWQTVCPVVVGRLWE